MKFLIIACLSLALAHGQVTFLQSWPANENTPAGARGIASSPGLGNGSCLMTFPGQVFWFHCETCDIVPEESDSFTGRYTLAVPNKAWQDPSNFTFVVNFMTDTYNETEIGWQCDSSQDIKTAVYSFPNNMEQNFTRSRIYADNLTPSSIINIAFPESVTNFVVDSPNTFIGGPTDFVISNFYRDQKEVAFQFNYDGAWFGAADITLNAVILAAEDTNDAEEA